jgi:hypothetical protein
MDATKSGSRSTESNRVQKSESGVQPEPLPTRRINGGGGGNGSDLHPLIQGLVDSLPPAGSEWTSEDCANWLQAAAFNFRLIYKGVGAIHVGQP